MRLYCDMLSFVYDPRRITVKRALVYNDTNMLSIFELNTLHTRRYYVKANCNTKMAITCSYIKLTVFRSIVT